MEKNTHKQKPNTKSGHRRKRLAKAIRTATRLQLKQQRDQLIAEGNLRILAEEEIQRVAAEKREIISQNEIEAKKPVTLFSQESARQEDLSLTKTAIKQDWPVNPLKKLNIVEDVYDIAHNENLDPNIRIRAAQTIVQMDATNIQRNKLPETQNTQVNLHVGIINQSADERRSRLDAIFTRIGITGIPDQDS